MGEEMNASSVAAKYDDVKIKFEYLDHTADVQIHSWGLTTKEAFEQACLGMFNYITDVNSVLPLHTVEITAEGRDYLSLLYNFMDEFLYLSCTDNFFMARQIEVLEFDTENWKIRAHGYGENFERARHGGKGTEVKAITYSAMKVLPNEGRTDIFVIIDI